MNNTTIASLLPAKPIAGVDGVYLYELQDGTIVTRQRVWQIKQAESGKCIICGKPKVTKNHCGEHRRNGWWNLKKGERSKLSKRGRKRGTKPARARAAVDVNGSGVPIQPSA